ncbi:DBP [Frog adenovirus 1]|uniref:DBP n=1 Tax=Frog adenovirus 1 (strain ATCC VR-896) TaxID=114102 RepID=Q9IIH3_ADEF1|nr:DBP [Frog adenovirus 1]AAF86934.1 DBP [Frog adenovirus 1]
MSEKRPAVDHEEEPQAKKQLEDNFILCEEAAKNYASALAGMIGCPTDVNLLPTSEFWARISENYIKKFRTDFFLTNSTLKSFTHYLGRLLASYVHATAGFEPKFNILGSEIWVHNWEEGENLELRCFHGEKMMKKTISYELVPTTVEAVKALASGEGKLEKGKGNKDVVKIVNNKNYVCPKDIDYNGFPAIHASTSCGLNFANGEKAKSAFLHYADWTQAMYPKANRASIREKMIIVTRCLCNFGHDNVQVGRQISKLTPFEIPGSNDLTQDQMDECGMMKATGQHQATIVFLCCNPVNFRAKVTIAKNCDFKLSMIDLRLAIKMSKEIWAKLNDQLEGKLAPAKLAFPVFKFDPKRHCYKSAVVCAQEVEEDEDVFC